MAESSNTPDDSTSSDTARHPNPPSGFSVSLAELKAMEASAAQKPAVKLPPADNGVPGDVAMSALMDVEEEAWREDLLDPDLTEEERANIMAKLDANQRHRRWIAFMKTIAPANTSPQEAPQPAPSSSSKKGKESSR